MEFCDAHTNMYIELLVAVVKNVAPLLQHVRGELGHVDTVRAELLN